MLAALYWIDFPRANAFAASGEIPSAVLADIGDSGEELEELQRLRRAS